MPTCHPSAYLQCLCSAKSVTDVTVRHKLAFPLQAFVAESEGSGQADDVPFSSSISNFFQTDAISRASSTMAKCVVARQASQG